MKFLKILFLFVFIFLLFGKTALAQEKRAAVLVNPIRGSDFWSHNFSQLETPKKQYELIRKNNFPASWLVRYDALSNHEIQNFLKGLDSSQDIGIFFEITPALAQDASVSYNRSDNWHQAKSVLLTGYSPEDRIKLIDTAFKKFNEIFGKNPKSVGAWWIDAASLAYMKDKYGVEANLDVADQYMTDSYQVWGQYWSTPFYPSKLNALIPAQSEDQKLGVVTMQWASRDPYNGYGNGVFESTYSVQVNDYLLHELGSQYFEKLLNIYPQTTVGLENDFDYAKFGNEYQKQLEIVASQKNTGKLNVFNMAGYAQNYIKANPGISPNVLIEADDPLGSGGKVIWLNTPKYRLGWFGSNQGSVIRDLRIYNDRNEEPCLKVRCDELKLAFGQIQAIDESNYLTKWVLDQGNVNDVSVRKLPFGMEISYKNLSGEERKIKVLENDIEVFGKISTIDGAILNVVTQEKTDKGKDIPFSSTADYGKIISKFAFNLAKFVLLVILFFFLPGLVFRSGRLLAVPIGISLFTLIAWILGFLKFDYLIWALPLISLVLVIKNKESKLHKVRIDRRSLVLALVIVLGSASWLITQVKNGILFNYGLGFWGPNGHDAIWHLSLISQLQKNVPPENPIFAGLPLSNYHYFFGLLVAKSATVLGIDPVELLFRLFPLLMVVFCGLLIFKVTEKISKSFTAGILSAFFLYFGGSFGWIVTYFKDKSFGGETMFWAQQSISTLLNPPFAISLVLFLAGLILFYKLIKQRRLMPGLALILLWGTLIEFKAYAGILVLGALGLFTLQRLILKRDLSVLLISLPVLSLSLLVFLPNNSGSQSLIQYNPLWLVSSMITAQDRLGWNRLTLTLQSGVLYKLIYGYSLGTLIFLAGNFGTRIISLSAVKEFFRQSFLFYFVLISVILPLVFIQEGTAWNIVQFLYYGLAVLNIFAGIALAGLVSRMPKILGAILILVIVLLTLPTTLGTFQHYLPQRPPAKLSAKELEALQFLRNQPGGVVLTVPFDEKLNSQFAAPKPLSVYTSTAYVSAFSGQSVFFEDTVNLEILGIAYKGRFNQARDYFKIRDRSSKIARENNISYVYLPRFLNYQVDEGLMGLKKIYDNDEVDIYKVQ